MRHAFAAAVVVIAATMNAAGAAPPEADPARLFGARETIGDISLSPDGTQVAFVGPAQGQGNALWVVDLGKGADAVPRRALVASGDPDRISDCSWVSNERLVCNVKGTTRLPGEDIANITRMVALNADGTSLTSLNVRQTGEALGFSTYGGDVVDWLPDTDGSVLMSRVYVPEQTTGTITAQTRSGLGVDRVDTRSGRHAMVEQPRATASEYISDGRGNVRVIGIVAKQAGGRYTGSVSSYQYRRKGSRDWLPLSSVDRARASSAFDPYAVDAERDVAYGLERREGRRVAVSMKLDGSKTETLLFAHPQVDVDGFVRIGRRDRVVGVSYATDKREAYYFDPDLKALAASLAKALPNTPLIRFVDSSLDERKLLLWAGSDVDPGRYYVLDRDTKKLNAILLARPALEKTPLASVRAVTYPAADGTPVPGYLTLPPGSTGKGLPAIVLPHGGPGARDEWGFDWLSQYYAARGYAVLQPNFRGSTGYGDAWFQNNGFKSWKVAIGDVADGGRWLVSQGIADPGRLAVVGWSYGGYAALQSVATVPGLFRAAVAIAPVTDLAMLKEESRGWSDYLLVKDFIGAGPHVHDGSPAQIASRIKVPVLMFHGELDRNVGIGESRLMASRLKAAGGSVELVTYPKLDHYLEDSEVRAGMLRKTDAFLRGAMGL